MPYVERVTKAGNTIEIERYFTSRYKKKGISRGDKVKPTKEEQEKVNTRQAERKLRILINANYGYGDYIECGVAAVEEEKKAVTVYYCDEAAVGMKFVAGDVSGTVQGVTHIQTDEAAAAGEAGNDRTALTLSKAVKAGCKVIALERTDTVAGMTTDDIAALKGVLKQYE